MIPTLALDPKTLPTDPATWSDEQHDEVQRWARDVRALDIARGNARPTKPLRCDSRLPTLPDLLATARPAWAEYVSARDALRVFGGRVTEAQTRAESARGAVRAATGAQVLAKADDQAHAQAALFAARATLEDLEARHTIARGAAIKALTELGRAAERVIDDQGRIATLREALASAEVQSRREFDYRTDGPAKESFRPSIGGQPLDTFAADLRQTERRLDEFLAGATAWPILDGREEQVVLVPDEVSHPEPWTIRDQEPLVASRSLTRELFGRLRVTTKREVLEGPRAYRDPELPLAVRLADLEG